MPESHPAFFAENNAHETHRLAGELRKKAQELLRMADDLEVAANLGIHYSRKAQGKQDNTTPSARLGSTGGSLERQRRPDADEACNPAESAAP